MVSCAPADGIAGGTSQACPSGRQNTQPISAIPVLKLRPGGGFSPRSRCNNSVHRGCGRDMLPAWKKNCAYSIPLRKPGRRSASITNRSRRNSAWKSFSSWSQPNIPMPLSKDLREFVELLNSRKINRKRPPARLSSPLPAPGGLSTSQIRWRPGRPAWAGRSAFLIRGRARF